MTNRATTRIGRSLCRGLSVLTAFVGLFGTVVGAGNSGARASEPEPLPSFAAEVETNFKDWDLDGDGALSYEETTRLVPRPVFRDTAAAALAAIHLAQRMEPRHRAGFPREALVTATPGALERRPPFELYFRAGLAHIRATERTLFVGDAPDLPTIRQGPLGDCYFIATLGAFVYRNRKDVDRLVERTPDGLFQIRFADREPVRVHHVTDAEIALGSFAEGQGLWLNVLEKAYGELIERSLARRGIVENALDALGDGGHPTRAIALLTGNDAGLLRFRPDDPFAVPNDFRVAGFLPLTRELLLANAERHLLTCCATSAADVPPGMARQHLYAILDFDPEHDIVHLWNPWGHTFEPRGAPGRAFGYAVRDGRFSVPLPDFIRIFDAVIYETEQRGDD